MSSMLKLLDAQHQHHQVIQVMGASLNKRFMMMLKLRKEAERGLGKRHWNLETFSAEV